MRRSVVTIHALHLVGRQRWVGICGRTGVDEPLCFTGNGILIFDPGDGLARSIRDGEAYVDSRAEVRSMNAREFASSDHHHQNRLAATVLLVLCVMGNDTQPHGTKPLGPVTVFTGLPGGYETIALKGWR